MKIYLKRLLLMMVIVACSNEKQESDNPKSDKDSLLNEIMRRDSTIDYLMRELHKSWESKSDTTHKGRLYEVIDVSNINNTEFAQVLNSIDTSIYYFNRRLNHGVRIISVCNGESDPNMEYYNCSHQLYVATGQYDLPENYALQRIGPFMNLKIKDCDKENDILTIEHDVRGVSKISNIKIGFYTSEVNK